MVRNSAAKSFSVFWTQKMMSHRFLLTIGLFLIGGLHTMIFAIFQIPGNFLLGSDSPELMFYCKLILYVCAVGVSLSHAPICRRLGLRKALYLGMIFNFLGMTILWISQSVQSGHLALIVLDMVFFGLALTSVINPLITYIVLEFPKRVGAGITALFAVFNLGVMMAPLLLDFFRAFSYAIYPFLLFLLLLSIWFIHAFFFDPPYPTHLEHLRKGSKLWKQLHYRLALFVLAIIAYSMTETTFNLWGVVQMRDLLGLDLADETISLFWLFMIVGQILLLIPLYFYPAKRVFYILIAVVAAALFFFTKQDTLAGFIIAVSFGGFGCSAIFPILLSMMEGELQPFAKGTRLLPYIEMATSIMMAGYFIGVGTIDLWVVRLGDVPWDPAYFHQAIAYIAVTGVLGMFLSWTAPKTTTPQF